VKYRIRTTKRFDKNLERCKKRNPNIKLLWKVVEILANGEQFSDKCNAHKLKGKYTRLLGMPYNI
jgi:mRNA interferase YafQ